MEEVYCNRCGSIKVVKTGREWRKPSKDAQSSVRVQRYRCNVCGKVFVFDGIKEDK